MISKCIELLKEEKKKTNESILDTFIKEYEDVLIKLRNKEDKFEKSDFGRIQWFTRIYLETSSDYKKEFLSSVYEIALEVEKYIYKDLKSV